MAGTMPFTIGADVGCTDGVGGKLICLVVDPRTRTVTHLVVNDRQLQGWLVPLNLVDVDAGTGQVRLRCTIAAFGKLDPAVRTMLLEGPGADPDVRDQNQLQFLRATQATCSRVPRPSPTTPSPPGR